MPPHKEGMYLLAPEEPIVLDTLLDGTLVDIDDKNQTSHSFFPPGKRKDFSFSIFVNSNHSGFLGPILP